MQVYFHGSEIVPNNPRECTTQRLHSWGIVINHNDTTTEVYGARMDPIKLKGMHEYVAIAEAIWAVKQMGIDLKDVVFHTTDEMLRDFASIFYHDNFVHSGLKESLMTRMLLLSSIFGDDILVDMLYCLTECRIKWVKPRNRHVYHARGSFLSRYANRTFRDMEMHYLDFDAWLKRGLLEYDREGNEYRWYPPFANTIEG